MTPDFAFRLFVSDNYCLSASNGSGGWGKEKERANERGCRITVARKRKKTTPHALCPACLKTMLYRDSHARSPRTYLFRASFSLSFPFAFVFEFIFIVDSLGGRLQLVKAKQTYRPMAAQVWYIIIKMSQLEIRIRFISWHMSEILAGRKASKLSYLIPKSITCRSTVNASINVVFVFFNYLFFIIRDSAMTCA